MRIDTRTVDDYAERMAEGDIFPPVVVFGTKEKCWIGDGWHRIMAATQIGAVDIEAELKAGNRTEALKCALSANATNALQRSNADKHRCVEIALKEFPNLSSRAIAELCGVSVDFVSRIRPLSSDDNATHTTKDGRQYPATRKPREPKEPAYKREEKEQEPETKRALPKLGPPRDGMGFARNAIHYLEQIRKDDAEREKAFRGANQGGGFLIADWGLQRPGPDRGRGSTKEWARWT